MQGMTVGYEGGPLSVFTAWWLQHGYNNTEWRPMHAPPPTPWQPQRHCIQPASPILTVIHTPQLRSERRCSSSSPRLDPCRILVVCCCITNAFDKDSDRLCHCVCALSPYVFPYYDGAKSIADIAAQYPPPTDTRRGAATPAASATNTRGPRDDSSSKTTILSTTTLEDSYRSLILRRSISPIGRDWHRSHRSVRSSVYRVR